MLRPGKEDRCIGGRRRRLRAQGECGAGTGCQILKEGGVGDPRRVPYTWNRGGKGSVRKGWPGEVRKLGRGVALEKFGDGRLSTRRGGVR